MTYMFYKICQCLTDTVLIMNRYWNWTNTEPIQNQYRTNTETILMQYWTNTEPILNHYWTKNEPILNQYRFNAKPILNISLQSNINPFQYFVNLGTTHPHHKIFLKPRQIEVLTNTGSSVISSTKKFQRKF